MKIPGLVGWSALMVAGVTCAGQESQDPAQLRRRLSRALDRGDVVAVERALSGREADPTAGYFLAEAAVLRGRPARADSLLGRVAAVAGPFQALAAARRAELQLGGGRMTEARASADRLARALEARTTNPALDWLALGVAYQILGASSPAQFKNALAAFDRAVAVDSSLIEANLRLGELLLGKYNAPDAKAAFAEALRRDPGNARAELGLAEVALFEGRPDTYTMVEKAVKDGPGLARAGTVLARMDLDAELFDSAMARADRAIGLDSTAERAWAVRGAVFLLRGDTVGFRQVEHQVGAHRPAPGGFYAEIAEALGRQRQYAAAARFAAEGVALAPDDPEVLTALGTNLLRVGRIDSGRAMVERAFARDPYHVWNKNTLDLLDQLATYRTVSTARFQMVGAPEEIDLLALHLGPLLERAYDSLAARYRYRPPTPVRIELYHHHADFSVRTVGLAGLGALGVSFGSVLAMDAPSARDVGAFNWGSTAWHELTHAFTLGMTDHQVPRWLSEGLSVLEERRARAGWGAHANPLFLAALKGNQLNPVSRLNDGFVRPRRAHDVSLAYYQASLLGEYLESTFGFESVLKLLAAYRTGAATPAAFQAGTGLPMAEVDRRFDLWLRARLAEPMKSVAALRDSTMGLGELQMMIESGKRLKAAKQIDQAVAAFERADRMFPAMADPESPAWFLAEIYRERGNLPRAIEYLARVTKLNDSHYRANRLEAELRVKQGDDRGALAALDRAVWISPYDVGMNQDAAALATTIGAVAEAVRFRQAVVALNPSDRAGALYQLAVAYRNAGDRAGARREVLRALEVAPSFEKAQMLLLELRGGR